MTTKPEPKIRVDKTTDGSPAIYVYDNIGEDSFFFDAFSAKDMRLALDEIGDVPEIDVHINSLGGKAYQAIAMHNLLKDHPAKIHTIVDGIAASAASVIFVAGDEAEMRTGSQLMIHEPANGAYGTAEELEKTINQLKATTESAIDIYEAKSGKSRESIAKMMKDETWMSAEEAKNEGFADKVGKSSAMAMKATPAMAAKYRKQFRHVPETALSLVKTESPAPEKKKGTSLMTKDTEGGDAPVMLTAEQFNQLLDKVSTPQASGNTPEQPDDDPVKAERHRVSEIHSVCVMAGLDAEQENKFVDEGVALHVVQKAALTQMATKNQPASDGGQVEPDENAAYRKEYKDAIKDGVAMTCSENEYVNVRRVEDGKTVQDFEDKGAK